MRALLDVNVLIAMLDQAHPHHDTALSWLKSNIGLGIVPDHAKRVHPHHVTGVLPWSTAGGSDHRTAA